MREFQRQTETALDQARAARRLVRLGPGATRTVRLTLRVLEYTFLPAGLVAAALLGSLLLDTPLPRLVGILLCSLVCHRLVGALLVELLDPRSAETGLLELDKAHGRYLYFWLRILNWVGCLLAPAIYVAGQAGLPPDLLVLSEAGCKLLGLVAACAVLVRRDSVLALLPRPNSAIGQAVVRVLRFVYPLLAIYLVGLLGLWTAGYLNLFYMLANGTVVVAGLLVVYALLSRSVTWLSHGHLKRWLEKRLIEGVQEDTQAETRVRAGALSGSFNTLLQISLFFAFVVVCVLALRLDWADFRTLLAFEVLPGTQGGPDQLAIPGIQLADVCFAVLTFFFFLFLARLTREILLRVVLQRTELEISSRESLGAGVFAAMVVFGIYLTSKRLGFDLELLKWMAGAIGLGLGFGLQNILSNFFSGLILLMEKPIAINDLIEVENTIGFVHRIRARSTTLRTRDNITVIIPNTDLISDRVINWSHQDVRTRICIDVGVAYGSDVSMVRKILLKVAGDHGLTLKKPAPDVLFMNFGDSSLDFRLHVWTRDLQAVPRIASDLRFAVDANFRSHGVEIPFPQRDLHVKELPAPAPKALAEETSET